MLAAHNYGVFGFGSEAEFNVSCLCEENFFLFFITDLLLLLIFSLWNLASRCSNNLSLYPNAMDSDFCFASSHFNNLKEAF